MIEKLIGEYVQRMNLDDIDVFAKKNGIVLNDMELNLIFSYIKNDWRTIVYGNPRRILDELKSILDPLSYQKIEELYIHFKDKYKDYL